jgi:hypothetical protein
MKLRAYITHKNAEKYSDCADYFKICPKQKKVAVSDGVSQSIMPLEWAKIIVSAFIDGTWDPSQDVNVLQQKWLKEANDFLENQRSQGINPWMLENCLNNKDGAGATFCGITFSQKNKWDASVLGDSCVITIDEQNKVIDIISSKDGKFDNRPDYFDSFQSQKGSVKTKSGTLKENQKLLLVSDPFSELLQNEKNSENETIIVKRLLSLNSYQQYLQLVDDFRNQYHMHDDDSTLIVIEYDGKKDITILDYKTLESLIAEEQDDEDTKFWNRACELNTKESFKEYLDNSSIKKYKEEAQRQINNIDSEEDNTYWKTVEKESQDLYEKYLSKYPNGLHSQIATHRIDELNQKSSEGSNGNDQEDQSETSSEDPDRCGQNLYSSNNSTLCRKSEEQVQADIISESADSTGEPTDAITKGTTKNEQTVSERDSVCNKITEYPNKVAKQVVSEGDEQINVSDDIDSFDEKFRQEFLNLLPVASELFMKYKTSFIDVLNDGHKCRKKPQEIFEQFWKDLANQINNNHG